MTPATPEFAVAVHLAAGWLSKRCVCRLRPAMATKQRFWKTACMMLPEPDTT